MKRLSLLIFRIRNRALYRARLRYAMGFERLA